MGLFDSRKKKKDKEEARRAEQSKLAQQQQQQAVRAREAARNAEREAAQQKSARTVDSMKDLKKKIEMWDKKGEVIEKEIDGTMKLLLAAQEKKKTNEFKRLAAKKALLERKLNNTRAEQMKMQQALDTLEAADSTSYVANTIESANTAIQEAAVDVDKVAEITDTQEEQAQNVQEAQSYLAMGSDMAEFDEDELLQELAQYKEGMEEQEPKPSVAIPSPPSNVPALPTPPQASAAADDAEAEIRRIEAEMAA